MERFIYGLNIALDSLIDNRLKSILTALGVLFGVAAVISMLAIGRGAKQEILEQMKLVGVNNIVITSVSDIKNNDTDSDEENKTLTKQKHKYSPGLSMTDVYTIGKNIPSVVNISPEISISDYAVQNGTREKVTIIGVSAEYFAIYNLKLERGTLFNSYQEENGMSVCIIGPSIRTKFFNKVDPIGKYIKFGPVWLKVIGVTEQINTSMAKEKKTLANEFNDDIYIPVKTMLLRFQNRGLINSKKLNINSSPFRFGRPGRNFQPTLNNNTNYHQLDKIIVHVKSSGMMQPTAEVISRLLQRTHLNVKDYEIRLPEIELKQEQRTKDIFNIVLGTIAGISLLVGGIGIMNIMYASVMERIKEIGIRMAVGAKKTDIILQFLSEAVLISITGGIIGIVLGIFLSLAINKIFGILTIVTPFSAIIAFGVSTTIGILFGFYPAKRASQKNPIESLHFE